MPPRSNRDGRSRATRGAVWAFLFFFTAGLRAEPVIFQLHNGDRVAGSILSETTNAVVITTPWARELTIPLEHIESRKPMALAPSTNSPVVPPAAAAVPTNSTVLAQTVPATKNPVPIKPRSAKEWRADVKMGMDLIYGARDGQHYYGQFALTYARPQQTNPGKFFRNTLEYRVDYAETDGVESANRMSGSNKTDFDIGRDLFIYNFMGVGYDEVRKIDLQYEIGPGLGCHLLRQTNFVANVEAGLSYQLQDRVNSPTIEASYARVGEDFTWKLLPRVTLTQRASLLIQTTDLDQMQLRLEANLSLGIIKTLSLNLTAIELYDTRPVPGVSQNEFQLRSSIGLGF